MKLIEFAKSDLNEGINDPNIFKAVFVAGPPGAGKNHVISALGLSATGLKLLDIDHTLYYLYKSQNALDKFAQISDSDYEDAREIEQAKQAILRKNMLGLIVNTTGREPERIRELKNELEDSGYDTFMVFVDASKQISASRIAKRSSKPSAPQDNRIVSKAYFDAAHTAASNAASYYAMLFGEQFAFIENNVATSNESLVTEDPSDDFAQGLQVASKKIRRFLRKPLTQKAISIVSLIQSKNQQS